ncbi:hypothetical protein [Marinibactrum halimedae]|uniref:Uncharacterized protein n=1 Tax=Marinibactrum halimedae TaxID=1444977 RepID=A0AA37T568_9GAMM|nr:hypothetical protein [Marinibactrum halimedae]MCD9461350.1 hypothetical protein [Marinibactrum halimedae]GLS25187.1 hypothetical protein GCM10007877_09010 [Marinibactrum halimedae]
MSLYTIVFDNIHYLGMIWDSTQVAQLSNNDMDHRIDMNGFPIRHGDVFKEPVRVSFEERGKEDEGLAKPDIAALQGRLYLSKAAYDVLADLLKEDGEFLPLIDEGGNNAYLFTPLRIAEDIDALDTALSKKNEWGDIEHLAFFEEKLKDWMVFRAEFNGYYTLQCKEIVKITIQRAKLTGVFFTPDLGNYFSNQFDEKVISDH